MEVGVGTGLKDATVARYWLLVDDEGTPAGCTSVIREWSDWLAFPGQTDVEFRARVGGLNPAADRIDWYVELRTTEARGRRQPGGARPDHDDVGIHPVNLRAGGAVDRRRRRAGRALPAVRMPATTHFDGVAAVFEQADRKNLQNPVLGQLFDQDIEYAVEVERREYDLSDFVEGMELALPVGQQAHGLRKMRTAIRVRMP